MAGQRNAPVLVIGRVVKTERKTGEMPAEEDPNRMIRWDFNESRVITPEHDALDVRFPVDGTIDIPSSAEVVMLRCEARAGGGQLKLFVREVLPAPEPAAV